MRCSGLRSHTPMLNFSLGCIFMMRTAFLDQDRVEARVSSLDPRCAKKNDPDVLPTSLPCWIRCVNKVLFHPFGRSFPTYPILSLIITFIPCASLGLWAPLLWFRCSHLCTPQCHFPLSVQMSKLQRKPLTFRYCHENRSCLTAHCTSLRNSQGSVTDYHREILIRIYLCLYSFTYHGSF